MDASPRTREDHDIPDDLACMGNIRIHPALRYHGGKYRIAPRLLPLLPPHRCYVEPYSGSAGMLLQKPRSAMEVYNDLDDEIVNFFRVLRCRNNARQLIEQLNLTPYARAEFQSACLPTEDPVERARRTAIRAMMGFGSAGATKGTTGMSMHPNRLNGWRNYPHKLHGVIERLHGVLIENRPALDIIRHYDSLDTLYFVDPPYLSSTRNLSGACYRHEMTDDEHVELLRCLCQVTGMVMLCTYSNALYDQHLPGWISKTYSVNIAGQRGSGQRVEQIWFNPRAAETIFQQELFSEADMEVA